jgi:hypothetical protein
MTDQTCPHCGGTDIVRGIHVGKTAEAGDVGLSYQTALIITGTEPMLADLCQSCGTLVRLWVQQVDRKWWITGK